MNERRPQRRDFLGSQKAIQREGGFTLVEMLVVVGIVGLAFGVAIPSISNFFKISINSATRELAATVKQAYNSTMITGLVHRVVYDFKKNEFWVEVGPTQVLLNTKETKEAYERKLRFKTSDEQAEIKKQEDSKFSLAKSVTKKKLKLPTGVIYADVVTEQFDEPQKEGTAYTHFFPHGMTEQTLIHLKDNQKHSTTLVISSLLGKTIIFDRYVDRAEALGETGKND